MGLFGLLSIRVLFCVVLLWDVLGCLDMCLFVRYCVLWSVGVFGFVCFVACLSLCVALLLLCFILSVFVDMCVRLCVFVCVCVFL